MAKVTRDPGPAFANHPSYIADVQRLARLPLDWEILRGRSIAVAGASGMLGSLLVEVLLHAGRLHNLDCNVYALCRDVDRARMRFATQLDAINLHLHCVDVISHIGENLPPVNFIVHAASNTHPRAYALDPIGTVLTNVRGTQHLLEWAGRSSGSRLLMVSSVEIYGENRGDVERFDERYCGYIDCNTVRAGYPESKRLAEALCQAFASQRGQDVVIARLARSYGPSMLPDDSKALSQFIRNALLGQDVVLKSNGLQRFAFTHASDAVSGLLHVLLAGHSGKAYNVAHLSGEATLRDLAATVGRLAGTSVRFELPDEVQQAGQSLATVALMDGRRIAGLGWTPLYDLESGLRQTLTVLS